VVEIASPPQLAKLERQVSSKILVVRGWYLLEPGAFKPCINGVGSNIVNPLGRVIDTSTREKWTRE
jgi:hypothetical protein